MITFKEFQLHQDLPAQHPRVLHPHFPQWFPEHQSIDFAEYPYAWISLQIHWVGHTDPNLTLIFFFPEKIISSFKLKFLIWLGGCSLPSALTWTISPWEHPTLHRWIWCLLHFERVWIELGMTSFSVSTTFFSWLEEHFCCVWSLQFHFQN